MARGWKGEPARHGLASKGIKTGRKLTETPDERDFRRGEVRRDYAEPLKFVEPVNRLHMLAKKYRSGITKEEVLLMAKRNPMSFFMDLTGEMPLNSKTRKDSDKMAKLALEIDLGRKVN